MPLIKSGSKKAISQNISEFHGGKTYNKTKAKFGKQKADAQAVAVAMSNARKYADGGDVSDEDRASGYRKLGRAMRDDRIFQHLPMDTARLQTTVHEMNVPQGRGDSLPELREQVKRSRQNIMGYAAGGASPSYWEKSAARGLSRGTLLHSDVPGRTDKLPIKVQSGSYVIPSDIISGLGQGNTQSGDKIFTNMVHSGKLRAPKFSGFGMKKPRRMGMFARGGSPSDVPIMAAGGERVVSPDEVAMIGHGDHNHGHDFLDKWVVEQRKKLVKTLRKLPPPQKD